MKHQISYEEIVSNKEISRRLLASDGNGKKLYALILTDSDGKDYIEYRVEMNPMDCSAWDIREAIKIYNEM